MNHVCVTQVVQHSCTICATVVCDIVHCRWFPGSSAPQSGAREAREEAILDAARDLAAERRVRSVTLTAVAEMIGMHKSALLRLLRDREEILLLLTREGWQEWSPQLQHDLRSLRKPTPRRWPAFFARTLAARGLFCDLLAHTPLNLERNVSLDANPRVQARDARGGRGDHRSRPGDAPDTERGRRPRFDLRHDCARRVALADRDPRARGRKPLPERPTAGTRGGRLRAPAWLVSSLACSRLRPALT